MFDPDLDGDLERQEEKQATGIWSGRSAPPCEANRRGSRDFFTGSFYDALCICICLVLLSLVSRQGASGSWNEARMMGVNSLDR